jgi:hypothetical protein
MSRSPPLLAAPGVQCSQSGPSQDKDRGERVGKYMIRQLLALDRLSLDEQSGHVGYRYGKEAREVDLNILRDSPFDRQKRSVGLPALFASSAGPPHALTHFELSLTARFIIAHGEARPKWCSDNLSAGAAEKRISCHFKSFSAMPRVIDIGLRIEFANFYHSVGLDFEPWLGDVASKIDNAKVWRKNLNFMLTISF